MTAEWLQWYYLIYFVPFGIAVLILVLSGMGGHHVGRGHAGHDGVPLHGHPGHVGGHGEASAVGHVGHFGSAGHTGTVGPAAHGGGDHHGGAAGANHQGADSVHTHELAAHPNSEAGHISVHAESGETGKRFDFDVSVGSHLLYFFGMGRAPLSVLIGSLMIGWGLGGLLATESLEPVMKSPDRFIAPAMVAALIMALVLTKLIGELAARFMPKDETYGVTRDALVGLTGTVVYPVSDTMGRVHVFDEHRTLHVETARLRTGNGPIPRGKEVLVVGISSGEGHLLVDDVVLRSE